MNNLSLNFNKSKCMLCGNSKKSTKVQIQLNVKSQIPLHSL